MQCGRGNNGRLPLAVLFQFCQFLLKCIHLRGLHGRRAGRAVSDIFAPLRKGERAVRLGEVVACGRAVHKHQCLRISSDGVGHEHGQRVVAVRNMRRVLRECRDNIPEGGERLVDALGLLWARRVY